MSGLRARQQSARADQILDAATQLFNEAGFADTRVEDIAERAGVAPATVYNYYATKANIILALAERHLIASGPERRAIVDDPPADPVDAIRAYEGLLIRQCQQVLTKECWRVVFSALYAEPGGLAFRAEQHLNSAVRNDYRKLLATFRSQGRLAAHADVEVLSEVIFAIDANALNAFLNDDRMTPDQFDDIVNRQVELVLRGFVINEQEETTG
jgi:AcrR family transcriptional regulator